MPEFLQCLRLEDAVSGAAVMNGSMHPPTPNLCVPFQVNGVTVAAIWMFSRQLGPGKSRVSGSVRRHEGTWAQIVNHKTLTISLKHRNIFWQGPCVCAARDHTCNCRIVDFNFRQLEVFCRPACCSFPGAGADSGIAADEESITSLFLDSYPESDLSRCEVAGSTGLIWS